MTHKLHPAAVRDRCPTGKTGFTTEAHARHAMRRQSARLRAFLCILCRRWHWTAPEKA